MVFCFLIVFTFKMKFLNLILKTERRNLMLARGFWGQLLGEGNIEGNLERQVGLEGRGVNTFRMEPRWVR